MSVYFVITTMEQLGFTIRPFHCDLSFNWKSNLSFVLGQKGEGLYSLSPQGRRIVCADKECDLKKKNVYFKTIVKSTLFFHSYYGKSI